MEDPKFVRPLLPMEKLFAVGCERGILITCYQATLSSKQPITSEEVLEALHWMYKKIPSLRLYLRERDGKTWFAEMPQEIIDFEAYPHGSASDVMQALLDMTFDSFKGPLWRARFIQNDNAAPCPLPKLAMDFPFQSQFFIGIHHSITDGSSNLKIMEAFVQLLNRVIEKLPINEMQIGVFGSGEKLEKLYQEKKRELLANQMYYNRVKAEERKVVTNVNTLWEDSIGLNIKDIPKTFFLNMFLNEENTANVLQKCKTYGVAVNSALCALINIQLAEMFKERGVIKDFYNIGSLHFVNLRRYWNKTDMMEFGVHLETMRIYISTPVNIKNDFWIYAKQIHEILHQKLAEKWPVTEGVILSEISPLTQEEMEKFYSPDRPGQFHYALSNLGNADQKVQGAGDHVQWTELRRLSVVHNVNTPFNLFYHTFRKRLSFLIACDSRFVPEDIASLFVNIFEKKLLTL